MVFAPRRTADRLLRQRFFEYTPFKEVNTEKWYNAGKIEQPVETITKQYDKLGNLTRAENSVGVNQFTFDALNRITRADQPFGAWITYVYDAAGRVINKTDKFGAVSTIVHTDFNELKEIAWSPTGNSAYVTIVLDYNPRGQLVQVEKRGPQQKYVQTLKYKDFGDLHKIEWQAKSKRVYERLTYEFDALKRLAVDTRDAWHNKYDKQDPKMDHHFELKYDEDGELKQKRGENEGESFTFDRNGNRVGGIYKTDKNRVVDGAELTDLGGEWNAHYEYDEEGNVSTRNMWRKIGEGSSTPTPLTLVEVAQLNAQYDHLNRVVYVDHRRHEEWRAAGSPPSVRNSSKVQSKISYRYDALGNRVEEDDGWAFGGVGVRRFVYDGPNLYAELSGDNSLLTRYVHGAVDQLFAQIDGTASPALYWHMTDRQGSILRMLRDSDGEPGAFAGDSVQSIRYLAFGMPVKATKFKFDRFGYTGREHDRLTGLNYYRGRTMMPGAGRFMQEDSWKAVDTNPYRYARNSPYNFNDPSGHEPVTIGVIIGVTALAGLLWAESDFNHATKLMEKPPSPEVEKEIAFYAQRGAWVAAGSQVLAATSLAFVGAPVVAAGTGFISSFGATGLMVNTGLTVGGLELVRREGVGIYNDWGQMSGPERLARVGSLVGPLAATPFIGGSFGRAYGWGQTKGLSAATSLGRGYGAVFNGISRAGGGWTQIATALNAVGGRASWMWQGTPSMLAAEAGQFVRSLIGRATSSRIGSLRLDEQAERALLKATAEDLAAFLARVQSNKERGPVLTVLRDRQTGELFDAQNLSSVPDKLHPILQNRLRAYLAENGLNLDPRLGIPGAHSEVVALNNALLRRQHLGLEIQSLDDFAIYNASLWRNRLGIPVPRCDNCRYLTNGVRVLSGS